MHNIFYCILIGLLFCFSPAQGQTIIPYPKEVKEGKGSFILNKEVVVYGPKAAKLEVKGLHQFIQMNFGYELDIQLGTKGKLGGVIFDKDPNMPEEGYRLRVDKKGIRLTAANPKGWFYGVQTLKQLLPIPGESKGVNGIEIMGVDIYDEPRFPWRAFMLDEGRYFKGMEQVKMLLDEMALLKMNVFHWHLVDDQGWRIEIKKYPRLTEIGSKRKSTQIGPLKWKSPIQSAEPHEGYYTQDQIKAVVAYAAQRHITIVPEIEMPGHSSAAIAAYTWLGTGKQNIEVPIVFGVGKDVYDVTDPRVNQFLRDVLDEVMDLFPSQVIHIGGDEVKYNHWKESVAVQAYMQEQGLASPADLQVHFTNGISQYIQSKGRRMMGWNEILGHNLHEYQDEGDTEVKQELAKESVIHFWKGDLALATNAAQKGYEIVNSLHSETYLDYSYTSIPLSRAYAFDPIPEGLDPEFHHLVIGTGCQMWGEWIPTNGEMHFQTFPRIAAYAEVGWTPKEHKDYQRFLQALKPLQAHWKQKGIYFAPNAFVEKE